jgi:hypothetical protein
MSGTSAERTRNSVANEKESIAVFSCRAKFLKAAGRPEQFDRSLVI